MKIYSLIEISKKIEISKNNKIPCHVFLDEGIFLLISTKLYIFGLLKIVLVKKPKRSIFNVYRYNFLVI